MSTPSYYNIPNGSVTGMATGIGIVQFNSITGAGPGGTDFGYIGDDVDINHKKTFDLIYVGTPLVQIYQVLQQSESMFSCNSLQITPQTFGKILGGDPVTSIAASLVTITAQVYTMAPWPLDPTFNAVFIGQNQSATPTVTNGAATPTTYTKGTDYMVDATNGWIVAIPGGGISATEALTISTTYTPPAQNILAIGNYLQTTFYGLTFTNIQPDGDAVVYYLPSVMAEGNLAIKYKPKNSGGMKVNGKWRGVYTATYYAPDGSFAPYGYIGRTVTHGV